MAVRSWAGAASRRWAGATALASVLLLAGCATGPTALPHDPLEPLNRSVQRFNDGVDEAVLKPVATAYRDHLPSPVRTGVGNFFGNLRDLWSSVNAVLQLRPREAAENFMRFNVNTVFGLGGVLDIASEMGIERTRLDMGHTLGHWGVPAGPYLVLPLLGPSSVRDTTGLVIDRQGDGVSQWVDDISTRNTLTALRVVDTRASLLGASALLDQAALDKYSFTRDAYLQRRQSQIQAGRPEPQDGSQD
jgi:phospholipid-binding lipoprotein MlaA